MLREGNQGEWPGEQRMQEGKRLSMTRAAEGSWGNSDLSLDAGARPV